MYECGARVKQNHHGKSIMLVREFHHTLDHRLMTQVHAIKCAQCHHGLLIVTERGPFNRPSASGVRCVISISVLFLLSVRCYSCNIDVVVRGLYQAALFTASTYARGNTVTGLA